MTDDVQALINEAHENIPRDLGDWANLSMRLLSALERSTGPQQKEK
jgi:hypothetical protein